MSGLLESRSSKSRSEAASGGLPRIHPARVGASSGIVAVSEAEQSYPPNASSLRRELIDIARGYVSTSIKKAYAVPRYLVVHMMGQLAYLPNTVINESELNIAMGAVYSVHKKYTNRWDFSALSARLTRWEGTFKSSNQRANEPAQDSLRGLLLLSADKINRSLEIEKKDPLYLALWAHLFQSMARADISKTALVAWTQSVLRVLTGEPVDQQDRIDIRYNKDWVTDGLQIPAVLLREAPEEAIHDSHRSVHADCVALLQDFIAALLTPEPVPTHRRAAAAPGAAVPLQRFGALEKRSADLTEKVHSLEAERQALLDQLQVAERLTQRLTQRVTPGLLGMHIKDSGQLELIETIAGRVTFLAQAWAEFLKGADQQLHDYFRDYNSKEPERSFMFSILSSPDEFLPQFVEFIRNFKKNFSQAHSEYQSFMFFEGDGSFYTQIAVVLRGRGANLDKDSMKNAIKKLAVALLIKALAQEASRFADTNFPALRETFLDLMFERSRSDEVAGSLKSHTSEFLCLFRPYYLTNYFVQKQDSLRSGRLKEKFEKWVGGESKARFSQDDRIKIINPAGGESFSLSEFIQSEFIRSAMGEREREAKSFEPFTGMGSSGISLEALKIPRPILELQRLFLKALKELAAVRDFYNPARFAEGSSLMKGVFPSSDVLHRFFSQKLLGSVDSPDVAAAASSSVPTSAVTSDRTRGRSSDETNDETNDETSDLSSDESSSVPGSGLVIVRDQGAMGGAGGPRRRKFAVNPTSEARTVQNIRSKGGKGGGASSLLMMKALAVPKRRVSPSSEGAKAVMLSAIDSIVPSSLPEGASK